MPILNHNDLKKVEEYQNFVRTSPYANATQDLAWEKVKEGWVGEQVYLEENGKIRGRQVLCGRLGCICVYKGAPGSAGYLPAGAGRSGKSCI